MGMEVLASVGTLTPFFTAGIFFVAFLSYFSNKTENSIKAAVEPLKEGQVRLESDIKDLKKTIQELQKI